MTETSCRDVPTLQMCGLANSARACSERFVRLGQITGEAAHVTPNSLGNSTQLFERWITLAPFHTANVTGINIRFQRQIFLRQALGLAGLSNPVAEHLQRSWLFQTLQARLWVDFQSSDYIHDFLVDNFGQMVKLTSIFRERI